MFQTTNQKKKKTLYRQPILPGMIIVIFVSGMILRLEHYIHFLGQNMSKR